MNIRINDPGKSYIHVVMKTMDDNFFSWNFNSG